MQTVKSAKIQNVHLLTRTRYFALFQHSSTNISYINRVKAKIRTFYL